MAVADRVHAMPRRAGQAGDGGKASLQANRQPHLQEAPAREEVQVSQPLVAGHGWSLRWKPAARARKTIRLVSVVKPEEKAARSRQRAPSQDPLQFAKPTGNGTDIGNTRCNELAKEMSLVVVIM